MEEWQNCRIHGIFYNMEYMEYSETRKIRNTQDILKCGMKEKSSKKYINDTFFCLGVV